MATKTFSLLTVRLALTIFLATSMASTALSANFPQDFSVNWSPDHVLFLNNGQELHLTLDQSAGSGFASKNKFLFGSIDMQIKLVPGNSAGTVTAYYLSSDSTKHDEVDFEFLGNVSGQPYILQTNVFASGVGEREQRIYLWFDPSADFHTYSVLWNQHHIIFSVDGTPIRVFANNEAIGLPYLNKQPMGIFSSLWNGDSWATRGGLDKIDWSHAPFVASYRNYNLDACLSTGPLTTCTSGKWWNDGASLVLDATQESRLKWVQENYMVYNYCTDTKRNPVPPPECSRQAP